MELLRHTTLDRQIIHSWKYLTFNVCSRKRAFSEASGRAINRAHEIGLRPRRGNKSQGGNKKGGGGREKKVRECGDRTPLPFRRIEILDAHLVYRY